MTGPATVPAVLDALATWAADRKQFTRRVAARDARSRPVSAFHPDARRWCLMGRITYLCGGDYARRLRVDAALRAARSVACPQYPTVMGANDTGGIAAVRAMIARAREAYDGDA